MTRPPDLLLVNGTVLDPASGRCELSDVAVHGSRISAIGPALSREHVDNVIDVGGCYVTPGLIDFHVHSYWGVNPFGFDADVPCLSTGVTTAVDAGSSGPVNFAGFKRYIAQRSRTRMLAFVAIARNGVMNGVGELEDLRHADVKGAVRIVKDNPDVAVGIKVRLHPKVLNNGPAALRLAIEAGEASGTPVMVHIGHSPITIEEIVDTLRPGDILTHCYTPQAPTIIDEGTGRLRAAVAAAHKRGVLFDAAHASRHLDFNIVRVAMEDGLPPDVISTDLLGIGSRQDIGDLPLTMSKFLAMGMPLPDVVAACTINPARAIGWDDRIGCLAVGREADITVFEVVEGPIVLSDTTGAVVSANQRVTPRWTVRAGDVV